MRTPKPMAVRLGWVIHYVRDVEESLRFYERAFDLKRGFVAEDQTFGTLETGSTMLAFCDEFFAQTNDIPFEPHRPNKRSPAFEIGFVADDVDAAFDRAVKAGGEIVQKPKSKPWGQIVSYIRDPDGFLVEICSPLE